MLEEGRASGAGAEEAEVLQSALYYMMLVLLTPVPTAFVCYGLWLSWKLYKNN